MRRAKYSSLLALIGCIQAALLACAQTPPHPPVGYSDGFSPPITISQGGIYSGSWQSLDAGTPVVTIATADPVIIQNSQLKGPSTLIQASGVAVKLTVTNTFGTSMNPGVRGLAPGRFLDVDAFSSITVTDCTLEQTSGMVMANGSGGTVQIRRNAAHNIDGRISSGPGAFRTGNAEGHDFLLVQFVQIGYSLQLVHTEIAWNQVINEFGASRVEDNISIFKSGGVASDPVLIDNNYIQGAFPTDVRYSFSGGGIMLGDGVAHHNDEPAFVQALNNQVVATTNYGLAITSGHDMEISGNRAISSGMTPDGRRLHAANVGIGIYNPHHQPSQVFFNNIADGNSIAWMTARGKPNPLYIPGAPRTGGSSNAILPGPADEAAELTAWQQKLQQNGVSVGAR